MHKLSWILFFLFFSSLSFAQTSFSPSLLPVLTKENKYGYADQQQNVVIEPQFDEALPFTGNYALVKKNNLWGLVNSKGKMVIPAIYENLGWTINKTIAPEESGEVIAYQQDGKWGLISVKNKIITAPAYTSLDFVSSDRIKAGTLPDQHPVPVYTIINTKGKEILALQNHYVELLPSSDKLLVGQLKVRVENKSATAAKEVYEYGIKNWNNDILLPLQYKKIIEKDKSHFEVLPFNTYKIMSPAGEGEKVVRADSLYPVFADIYATVINGATGYFTAGHPVGLKANMQSIQPAYQGFSVYKQHNKYGITTLNLQNQLSDFLPPVYDSLSIDSTGFILAGQLSGTGWQWELFTKNNNGEKISVSKQPYHAIHIPTASPFIKVMKNNLYGFISKAGSEVIPLQFDSLGDFSDSLCVAVYQGKYGILHKDGSWYFQPKHDYYALNQFGHAIRREKAQYEVTDLQGKKKYSTTAPLRFMPDGSIEISQKGKVGRISPSGTPCVPAVYDSISPMTSDQTFWAMKGSQVFLYTASGEMLIKQGDLMKDLHFEKSNFAPVKINGRYGFIDGLGRLRITNQYEQAQPFSEGLAAVKFTGKWGYLNTDDKIIIQPYYDEVSPFQNGTAIVKKGQKYGLIDAKGKELSAFIYDQIIRHPAGVFITSVKDKKGLLGTKGNELIYAKYEQLYPQANGMVVVQLASKFGVVAQNGVSIYSPQYDLIITNPISGNYILVTRSKLFETKL